ncbi:hypothetical protein D3C84_1136880 [compost metagenome]
MSLVSLQNNEACLGLRTRRREQQIDRHLQAPARLQNHQATKAIVNLVDIVHLVEHGLTGNVEDTSSDDFADFAFAMHVDQLKRFLPAHDVLSYLMYQPQG